MPTGCWSARRPLPRLLPPVPVDAGPVVVDGDFHRGPPSCPPATCFAMLHEVGHRIGEVAYLDPSAGLLEIVVELAGYGACSVMLTLQGRDRHHRGVLHGGAAAVAASPRPLPWRSSSPTGCAPSSRAASAG